MSEFEVKTRGNSSPNDKPRVYFSCYEDDFKNHFKKICGDIFKTHDCAIYYTEDMNAEHDELNMETDLGRMNLFVIPVTYKLLRRKPNRTMDTDLAFAKKNHIAVLPIMMENDNDIDEIYSREENFGELQYLKPYSNDPTEISYEEKLKKYLDSILISNELVKRIRAAFDAYIFLSYRKNDRRFANDLLKIIHNIPGCYDIAVWYDEFLTPGKSFRESIDKMLKESKLFTLLVTPNLLEDQNYVMTDEYPAAAKSKMNILPAEMESTDSRQLEEKYNNIPQRIDPYSKEFEDIVSKILNHDNNSSPEHNYLMGLAYLDGIDVERNAERGVSLLTTAADANLPEAIEKLVSIYSSGDGVKRDYKISLDWQEKLADCYERLFKKDPAKENYDKLFKATLDLGNAYDDMTNFNNAKVSYMRTKELAEETGSRLDLALSYNRLGDIAIEEMESGVAEQYYMKAFEIHKALVEETGTVEARHGLAVNYGKLGYIAELKGKSSKVKQYYMKAFEIRKVLAEETGKVQSRHDLAVSYEKLGNIAKSNEIFKALAEETGKVGSRYDLLESYRKLGDIAQKEGKSDEVKQYYLQCLEIHKALAEETGKVQPQTLCDLHFSYLFLGFILEEEGKLDEVKQYYIQYLEIIKAWVEETGTVEARRGLSSAYSWLGGIAEKEKKFDEAKQYYLQYIEARKALALAEKTGKVKSRSDIAESYFTLGGIALMEGKIGEAMKYYLQAFKIHIIFKIGIAWAFVFMTIILFIKFAAKK